jgi:hypothetical protein
MNAQNSQVLFFRWLAVNHPTLYAPVAKKLALGSLGDLSGWVDTLVSAIATVGTAVIAKKQSDKQISAQKKADAQAREDALKAELLSINLQRAQAGLPPVDMNGSVIPQTALPTLPTPQAAYAAAQRAGSPVASFIDSVPVWAWLAGGAVVVFLLVRK